MRCRFLLFACLMIVVVLFSDQSTAQDQEAAENQNPELAWSVPQPITVQDVDRFARMIELSESQLLFFTSEFQKYQADWERMIQPDLAELRKLSKLASAENVKGYTPAFAQLYQEFTDLEGEIRKRTADLDDKLIDALIIVLHETQLPAVGRVRQTRDRERCFPLYLFVNGAQIDLSQFVRAFYKPKDDEVALDELLREYEAKATPLFIQLRKAIDEHAPAQVWALSQYQFDDQGKPRDPNTPEAIRLGEAYFAQNRTGLGRSSALQEKLLRLNEGSFSAIKEKLQMTETNAFVREFRRLAYPDAYPDPTDPIEVYESILKNEEFDDHTLESIQSMWDAYRETYNAKNAIMQEKNTKWRIQLAQTEIQSGYGEYLQHMSKLRNERMKLNQFILRQIEQSFEQQLSADSKSLIQNQQGRIEVFVRMNQPAEE